MLTDGPGNNAYYEHARLAAAIGAPIATLEQLHTDGERLLLRTADSELRQIDVVYRRTDVDWIRDAHGAMTPVAQTLLPAWLAGNLGLVNAFGNGVADDKLVHAHVEDFVRFYLGEEPLVRSVPTTALDSPESGADAIERLHELVVKPRHGHGGTGVTIGSQADEATLRRARAELERHPERYIVQPIVPLSQHPTVIDGRARPPPRRPAAVRVLRRRGGAGARRALPGVVRRGRDDRQLLTQRRRQGHLGAGLRPGVTAARGAPVEGLAKERRTDCTS